MTVVALDGMGGDFAPGAVAEGAVRSAGRGVEVVLVGDEELLARELERLGGAPSELRVVHAADAIGMQEHAGRETLRRRQSSIYVALELVKVNSLTVLWALGTSSASERSPTSSPPSSSTSQVPLPCTKSVSGRIQCPCSSKSDRAQPGSSGMVAARDRKSVV